MRYGVEAQDRGKWERVVQKGSNTFPYYYSSVASDLHVDVCIYI